MSSFENSEVDPSFQLSVDMKGLVSHNKKNRQNVKVNYTNLHFLGNKLLSPETINYSLSLGFL